MQLSKTALSKLKSLKKDRVKSPRRACRGGDYLMPISFHATSEVDTDLLRQIQRHYKTGLFSQWELAEVFNMSGGLINKACRIMEENGGKPIGE